MKLKWIEVEPIEEWEKLESGIILILPIWIRVLINNCNFLKNQLKNWGESVGLKKRGESAENRNISVSG